MFSEIVVIAAILFLGRGNAPVPAMNVDLRGQVTLTSPAGTNFDLEVTCSACGGTTMTSTNGAGPDVIGVRRPDTGGIDSGYDIVVRVVWQAAAACGTWTLTVAGNAGSNQLQCN